MRLASRLTLVAVLSMAACREEPDFDQRFDAAQQEIRERAEAIDRDLAKRARPQGSERPASQPLDD